jgi:hypothetical protein
MTLLPEVVTPEGLNARASIMRERGDESCARHLELAAHEIRRLRNVAMGKAADYYRGGNGNRLDDPAYAAQSYQVDVCPEDRCLRIQFFSGPQQQGDMLAYFEMESPDVYDFSTLLMRDYDKLEGIE